MPAAAEGPQAPPTRLYKFTGYKKFLDPDGYPAVAPPWGTLNAIDLNTGQYSVENPARGISRAAAKTRRNRLRELRRPDPDRQRPALHRRHALRQEAARLRQPHRQVAVADDSAFCGQCDAHHLMAGGKQYVLIQADNARDRKAPRAQPMRFRPALKIPQMLARGGCRHPSPEDKSALPPFRAHIVVGNGLKQSHVVVSENTEARLHGLLVLDDRCVGLVRASG